MTGTPAGIVLRHIRGLVAERGDVPDGELLERFRAAGEEAAFEGLVRRHGALVLGVCRRVLGNVHDAEDAFQATFLTLARSAGAIGKPDALGSWLHGVAYRIAARARGQAAVRRAYERRARPKPPADALAEVTGRELVAVLDEELARLPERCRVPLVHCYLEGLTCDEAARATGWPVRTLKRRLEQGRNLLRARLVGRGLALPAALLAAGLTHGATVAEVPCRLIGRTVEGALRNAAGHEAVAGAAAVSAGLFGAAVAARLKVAAVLVVLGLIGLGVAGLAGPGGATATPPAAPAPPPQAKKADAGERNAVVVAGRVLGADGKPLAGAEVALVGAWRLVPDWLGGVGQDPLSGVVQVGVRQHLPAPGARKTEVLAAGKTGADGTFRLKKAGATADQFASLEVIAGAKGHGLDWRRLRGAEGSSGLELNLPAEQVIRGRAYDLQGLPADGVKGRVVYVADKDLEGKKGKDRASVRVQAIKALSALARADGTPGRLPGGFEFRVAAAPKGVAFWPRPFTADAEGRFELRGFGAAQVVHLLFEDDRFATQELAVETAAEKKTREVNLALAPVQRIEGRVVWEDTGKPAVRVRVGAAPLRGASAALRAGDKTVTTTTDVEGRFRLNPYPGSSFRVYVASPHEPSYLAPYKRIDWPQGAARQVVDFKLPRRVLIRGKVIEATSGSAVGGAAVYFIPRKDNAARPLEPPRGDWEAAGARSAPDGAYQLTVPPGPGHLIVEAPGNGLVAQTTGSYELLLGKPGGFRRYYDAVVPLDLKLTDSPREQRLEVRRGVTIRGEVVGPDGRPVKRAVLFAGGDLLRLNDRGFANAFTGGSHENRGLVIEDGKFELKGCDPERMYRIYLMDAPAGVSADASDRDTAPLPRVRGLDNFLRDAEKRLGALAEVSAKQAAGKPLRIKLAPCTSARVRIVDAKGMPSKHQLWPELIVTPVRGAFLEESVWLGGLVRAGETPALRPDAEGWVTIPALIPGATYRLVGPDPQLSFPVIGAIGRPITVQAGKTLRLPDIVRPLP
jgi:RNA polymerase sigma factor (sigma-70 family)